MLKRFLRKWGARGSDKDRYNFFISLLSKSYIAAYYERGVQSSPSLKEFKTELSAKLTEYDQSFNYSFKRAFALAPAILAIVVFLSSSDATAAGYVEILGIIVIYFIVLIYPLYAIRLLNEQRAAIRLFLTIRDLEKNDEHWKASWYRYRVARRVEHIARNLEHIPFEFRGIALSVRRDATKISATKAQALRQLEASIVIPSSLTRIELIDRLKNDLHTIADDRWFELPGDEPAKRVHSRWLSIIQISSSILIIGLAIFIPTIAAKAGGTIYSLVAALLASIGIALLNKAGLSTGYLSETLKPDDI